jgi:serine O-acetyltransferase
MPSNTSIYTSITVSSLTKNYKHLEKSMTVLEYIKSDLYRYEGSTSFKSFLKHYLISPGFKFSFYLRLCQHLKKKRSLIYIPVRLMLRRYSYRYGIDIPVDTKIGYGFYIGHFGGVVISSESTIGNNCNISQGITIGYSASKKRKGAPIIGDNVYIAPGAMVIGKIRIGDNVSIGGNAVVTKDCNCNDILVGIPAAPISSDGSGNYIINKWQVNYSGQYKNFEGKCEY